MSRIGSLKRTITPERAQILQPGAIKRIRSLLHLDYPPYTSIPDDLLELAFIPRIEKRSPNYKEPAEYNIVRRILHAKYGMLDGDLYEYLGDAVLELIIRDYLFDMRGKRNVGDLNFYTLQLVRNETLSTLLQARDLCKYILDVRVEVKTCADTLEALIGIIYKFLSFEDARNWFTSTFNLPYLYSQLEKGGAVTGTLPEEVVEYTPGEEEQFTDEDLTYEI